MTVQPVSQYLDSVAWEAYAITLGASWSVIFACGDAVVRFGSEWLYPSQSALLLGYILVDNM